MCDPCSTPRCCETGMFEAGGHAWGAGEVPEESDERMGRIETERSPDRLVIYEPSRLLRRRRSRRRAVGCPSHF
jgi:hypothetical protein